MVTLPQPGQQELFGTTTFVMLDTVFCRQAMAALFVAMP